ncbi:hypothetical protein BC629DRAFT_691519 [Irpex lacteus]|nr:hypothetical protein BC629DRAFT_691519 [Irpex lacteus]
MRFSTVAAALLPVAGVLAADHVILVGDTGLDFNPTSVTAAQGDNLIFSFVAKNHTVTQSTFGAPCSQSGSIDSGFMPIEAGAGPANYTVPVNDSTPVWFYCKQVLNGVSHCSQGMVFALNPTADKTFDAFQAAAKSSAANSTSSNSSSSAAPSGSGSSSGSSAPSASASGSGAPSASPSGQSSGAIKVGTTAAMAMSVVGLAAGVLL